MLKKTMKYTAVVLLGSLLMTACRKNDDTPATDDTTQPGTVLVECMNVAGGSNLVLNTGNYVNENGDSFTVSKFNYYITNIRLNGDNGTFTEAESYHLIEQGGKNNFSLSSIPAGKYNSITFTIGVDSLRNVSGAQTGDLDPGKGNFWTWSTGYIMMKFEGNSPKAPTTNGKLMYHAGGFTGANTVLRTITLNFAGAINVSKAKNNHVHLQADILKLFKSPNKFSFATTTTIHMPGTDAKKMADNYANMFSVSYAGE